jgi:hypothetical protein
LAHRGTRLLVLVPSSLLLLVETLLVEMVRSYADLADHRLLFSNCFALAHLVVEVAHHHERSLAFGFGRPETTVAVVVVVVETYHRLDHHRVGTVLETRCYVQIRPPSLAGLHESSVFVHRVNYHLERENRYQVVAAVADSVVDSVQSSKELRRYFDRIPVNQHCYLLVNEEAVGAEQWAAVVVHGHPAAHQCPVLPEVLFDP